MTSGLSQKYQKKTDREHVLDNPDTYIGSIENVNIIQPIARPIVSKQEEGVNFDQMYNGGRTGYEGMANIIHNGGQDQMANKNQGCANDIRSAANENISSQYNNNNSMFDQGPTAANEALGGGFGTSF